MANQRKIKVTIPSQSITLSMADLGLTDDDCKNRMKVGYILKEFIRDNCDFDYEEERRILL